MQIAFVFEKTRMSPGIDLGVLNLVKVRKAVSLRREGATAREINMCVEPFRVGVEFDSFNKPGRPYSKCGHEQLLVQHCAPTLPFSVSV
jgi:hypothetical protein